ncbi:hypothetical protein [uncultured Agrobacterium sp.]|uniref:hypothetical protein n=1 Tax=uncultured Agrobacterium sp. TaxID=157277 RepID=UPI0025D95922|nr:hypothetical protein [uncultured Agrobacterium sp.]
MSRSSQLMGFATEQKLGVRGWSPVLTHPVAQLINASAANESIDLRSILCCFVIGLFLL